MDWYARARELAPQYGLDPDLVSAIVGQESGGNPNARSPKNAQGLMQLIPETAKRFGVKDVWDPEQNLHGGLKYLQWLSNRFAGNLDNVLAGYNAGEGAVDKYGGIPPYKETQNYVKSIKAKLGQGGSTPPAITGTLPPGGGMPAQAPETTAMPQGTLPPEFSPPQPTMLSNMAQNPWLQMGLGILATNDIGQGMQQGLLGAAAAEQTRERNRLWQQQINQAQAGLQGMKRASEPERMRYENAKEGNRLRELELQAQMAGGGVGVGVINPNEATPESRAEYLQSGNPQDLVFQAKGGAGGAKQVRQAEEARTVVGRIRALRSQIESNPALAGPLAGLKLWAGKITGGIADETGSDWFQALSESLGTAELAGVNFDLAAAAAETARWVVNKGDTKMSNDDMIRANEIIQNNTWMKDSASTLAGLWKLENIIVPYMGDTPPETTEALPTGGVSAKPEGMPQTDWDELQKLRKAQGGL